VASCGDYSREIADFIFQSIPLLPQHGQMGPSIIESLHKIRHELRERIANHVFMKHFPL
jgi:hypothetical protein